MEADPLPSRLPALTGSAQFSQCWHTPPPFLSPQFQSLQLEREMCLASNCGLARVNLSLRPRLEDGKASLAIKYQELREIREACWDKQQRLGEWGTAEGTRQNPARPEHPVLM